MEGQALRSGLFMLQIGEMSGDASISGELLLQESAVSIDAPGNHVTACIIQGRVNDGAELIM